MFAPRTVSKSTQGGEGGGLCPTPSVIKQKGEWYEEEGYTDGGELDETD